MDELFDLPTGGVRLDRETHLGVFGELPSRLADELRTPEIGDLVLQLLDKGWRRGQLAARVGAMLPGNDPVADVTRLLEGFLDLVPPDARWREEKAERELLRRSSEQFEAPASDESRQAWLQQIRTDLGVRKGVPREAPRRTRPACAICGQESAYFVTKDVRLCDGCVEQMSTGALQLPSTG